MRRPSFVSLVLLLIFTAAPGSSQESPVRIAPAPEWIGEQEQPELSAPSPAKNPGGWFFLLFDRRFHAEESATYSHLAYRITNSSALQDGSQISVDYDPEYERIDFHAIRVVRAGKTTDRLSLPAIKTIQQERDLDRHLYNGQVTALVMLDDIRVDDVVEYAYTRRGRNPIYDGRFHDTVPVRWSTPLRKVRVSVFQAPERSISARQHGDAVLKTETLTHGVLIEQRWIGTDVPAVEPDSELPDWYSPYAFLQFSEYADWSSVLAWAQPLYDLPARLTPELEQKADELTQGLRNNEARVLAILNFVQREIRYLGIELGPKSHRPSPPAEVLARRFGDCKDKSLLLCALLKHVGIRATPALTHSYRRDTMRDWLPGPDVFDHVIACIQLNGLTYWVDPTISDQEGSLAVRAIPDYRHALPIAYGTDRLERIHFNPESKSSLHVEEHYDVRSFDGPAKLEVRSHYSGNIADSMRVYLRDTPIDQIAKNYLNTRLRLHPKITADGDPTWTENKTLNTVTVIHRYTVPDMWAKTKDSPVLSLETYPAMMRDYAEPPDSPRRSMPLAVLHPFRAIHETFLQLPETWPDENNLQQFESEAFRGEIQTITSGATSKISYKWESRRDHVPAAGVAAHAEKLRSFRDAFGSSLTYNTAIAERNENFRLYWPVILSLLGTLLVSGASFWWLQNRQPRDTSSLPPPLPSRLQGLGGWLVFVAIGLFARPLMVLVSFFQDYGSFFDARVVENLTTPSSSDYAPGFSALLCTEISMQLLMLVVSVWLLVLFFQHRRLFPKIFIIMMLSTLVWGIIDTVWVDIVFPDAEDDPSSTTELVRTAIGCAIWVPYMLSSRRVRATFVR
ncbi:hypothetical protein CMV30_07890 [Nibricoccus aquaticus]|uniref:DUF3857 domain-containing protein n=1 Tax=Nibricoccus aquaticus TaxID=2576891 RepID=A0A290Q5V7_9BACT|nr:DUF2569 family protein [Nibricoccus aquaticus]ATC63874.1 hypothetical protein CMV30_07890 [Nibricoccus aquaticus]